MYKRRGREYWGQNLYAMYDAFKYGRVFLILIYVGYLFINDSCLHLCSYKDMQTVMVTLFWVCGKCAAVVNSTQTKTFQNITLVTLWHKHFFFFDVKKVAQDL